MMNYELFKKIAMQRIMEFMPEEYADWEPTSRSVNKINGAQDGFCIMPPEPDTAQAYPTLYLNDLYEEFTRDEDMDRVLEMAAQIFSNFSGRRFEEMASFRLEDHKDRIIFNLVSADLNDHMLEGIPHRFFMDMAVIYRMICIMDEDGINSAIITNDLMDKAGLTEADLYDLALGNTRQLFPIKIMSGGSEKYQIVTNDSASYGAVAMLYGEVMEDLADRLGGDFYILPTSIHEFFAIAAAKSDPLELSHMLAHGNKYITHPAEVLSTIVYRYVEKHHKIIRYMGYLEE